MTQAMTLDEIVTQADGFRALVPPLTDDMRRMMARTRAETARETSAHFLYTMLLSIETLFDGSKPQAGQLFDDAITHFLASLKAELGDGYTSNCAAIMIRNIALFLDGRKRDLVLAALDVEGKSR